MRLTGDLARSDIEALLVELGAELDSRGTRRELFVRLDPELKQRLRRRADVEGVPVSEVIREALRHHLEAS